MKLEANTTLRGVTLSFVDDMGGESVTVRHGELERLSVEEGINLLMVKLYDVAHPARTEPEEIVLEGDEDDEDLSLFDDVTEVQAWAPGCWPADSVEVQTPAQYLRERGHI
jgi:hypothetical protein